MAQTLSPNLLVSASAAYFDNGFGFLPRGGPNQSFTVDYDKGIAYGSNTTSHSPAEASERGRPLFLQRPRRRARAEVRLRLPQLRHDQHPSHFNGNQLVGAVNSPTDWEAQVWRDIAVEYTGRYYGTNLGDVYTRDRLSLKAGLRWDVQRARNLPCRVSGSTP